MRGFLFTHAPEGHARKGVDEWPSVQSFRLTERLKLWMPWALAHGASHKGQYASPGLVVVRRKLFGDSVPGKFVPGYLQSVSGNFLPEGPVPVQHLEGPAQVFFV